MMQTPFDKISVNTIMSKKGLRILLSKKVGEEWTTMKSIIVDEDFDVKVYTPPHEKVKEE